MGNIQGVIVALMLAGLFSILGIWSFAKVSTQANKLKGSL